MDPGNGGIFVMSEVPVVVEPDEIERCKDPEVACAASDVAFSAVMVDVLHGRPGKTEGGVEDAVIQEWNLQEVNDGGVQTDCGETFEADPEAVFRIERFHEGFGGTIDFPKRFGARVRPEEKDDVTEDNQKPIKAGENSVKSGDAPPPVVVLEIEVEGFVIGTIAEVMAEMTLTNEMERGGKKQ